MSKKILITGGAGFIGSNFVRWLIDRSDADDIVVLDKLTYAGNLDNIGDLIEKKRITFVQGDIVDKAFIFDFFKEKRFALVVNFAAETHVDRSVIEPSLFVMTNIVGTQNLLDASREFGVQRYHQISTDEVYGDLGDGSMNYFTEETPIDPTPPYAASKAAADLLVMSFWKTYQLPVTISRCSNNYGPYQFPEKLIPYFFQLASQGKPLPLYGDGKNIRDWLFVRDHCEAISLILEKSPPGEIYNIGGHFERDNTTIAKLILKFLGKSENLITYVEDRLAHDRRYAIDSSKIEKKLGWKPRHTFQQGIAGTFEWYEKNKAWWKKLITKHTIDENRQHLKIRTFKTKTSRPSASSVGTP
jgi:dTDP-glucose 4,6-dehydratase